MVICSGVAVVFLSVWLIGQIAAALGRLPERLSTVVVPNRAVATLVLAVVGFTAAPRPATAEPLPPIVRLAEPAPEAIEPISSPPDAPADDAVSSPVWVVRRGDSLWRIAGAHLSDATGSPAGNAAIAGFWPRIYQANRALIGDDPNLILPGQQLAIPEA